MIYSDLAEAYGSAFGGHRPAEPPKTQYAPSTVLPSPPTATVKESFSYPTPEPPTPAPAAATPMSSDSEKLARILSLIEQNRTGYQPAATQDMLLYVATGVMFLFTFETFVGLGAEMRRS